jgi:glucan biosynthesis protein C
MDKLNLLVGKDEKSNEQVPLKPRLYYLDWLKVLFIVLIISGHSAMPFNVVPGMWLIQDAQTNVGFTLYVAFFYPFVMPLFFFISGAGTYFALGKRSQSKYLSERVMRLFVPLVACTLLLIPAQEYIVSITMGLFQGTFLQFLPHWPGICTEKISAPLLQYDCYVRHLWFLGFLFVYAVISLPIFLSIKREKILQMFIRLADFTEKPAAIWLFVIPTALIQALLRASFPGHHNLSDFFLWLLYFIYGFIFVTDQRFMEVMERNRWPAFAVGIITFITMLVLLGPGGFAQSWEFQPVFSASYAFYQVLRSINMWAWVIFIIGMGKRLLNFNNHLLQYTIEALLPVYIIHHVVIIGLAYLIYPWHPFILIKYLFLFIGTLLITFSVYEFLIKRIDTLRLIFGMRLKTGGKSQIQS